MKDGFMTTKDFIDIEKKLKEKILPSVPVKTIQVSKELINDLIPIIDDRIHFINCHLHLNRGPLGDELQRLKEFSKIIDKMSCEK